MAQNPMQVKVRNARLIGLLIGLIIGGLICGILLFQLNKLKKEQEAEQANYVMAMVLNKDVNSGTEITTADLISTKVPRTAIPATYLSAISENKVAKIDLKAGTIITEEMIENSDEKTTNDTKLQEYTMIVLPTYLEIDDYIDIRLSLPNGQDLIVLSKKRVYDVNADTLWLKMQESEILTLNSAIIESYVIGGSKLYASPYTDPGMQEATTATYVPASEVVSLINSNQNITSETRNELTGVYNQVISIRNNELAELLSLYSQSAQSSIQSGVEADKSKIKDSRTKYFNSLNAVQ